MGLWIVALITLFVIGCSYVLAFILHNRWKLKHFKTILSEVSNSIYPKKIKDKEITPKVKISEYSQVIEESATEPLLLKKHTSEKETKKISLEQYENIVQASLKVEDKKESKK